MHEVVEFLRLAEEDLGGDLGAAIDWQAGIEPTPARLDRNHGDAPPAAAPPVHQAAMPSPAAPIPIDPLRTAVHGNVKYYCQKPWTDLHNFTVDGRMDVCCIATGESQTRYALGNLLTQSFQDVWNGPVAREFRRTVNSGSPLPPCRRCPMAFAYQGPLFDPSWTERRVAQFIRGILKRLPLGLRVAPAATAISDRLVSRVLFRGFKR